VAKVESQDTVNGRSSTLVLERELQSINEATEGEKRVLIVDDEESLVGALSEFLSMRGYEVSTATNARQALALIHESTFGVVVSDLRLPGMNGVELLEHVLDVDPETVMIIMTGYASVQSAVDALKKGAYDYVIKPFSVHELEKTLKTGLERRKLSMENLQLSHLMRKLVEIDQVKSNIISTVSHEFRTPLMSLRGYLSMLTDFAEEGNPISGSEKKWLYAMKDNLGRLEMLILNLLTMTEGSAGDLLIADDAVNLLEIVKNSASRLDGLARSRDIDVTVDPSAELMIRGDAEKLGVAFSNIIENAIKFNLESGSVRIAVSENDPEYARVTISDTGIGIPEDKIGSMFDCFTQLDMTRTRRFGGAGLGLPVAKMIIDGHHGRVHVESNPGRGSTFTVTLPRGGGQ
jgi:two-component system sensor histidine kinase/response regulator